jgi:hypothetical protein
MCSRTIDGAIAPQTIVKLNWWIGQVVLAQGSVKKVKLSVLTRSHVVLKEPHANPIEPLVRWNG